MVRMCDGFPTAATFMHRQAQGNQYTIYDLQFVHRCQDEGGTRAVACLCTSDTGGKACLVHSSIAGPTGSDEGADPSSGMRSEDPVTLPQRHLLQAGGINPLTTVGQSIAFVPTTGPAAGAPSPAPSAARPAAAAASASGPPAQPATGATA